MEGSQIPNANNQPVTVAAFSAKFRSKREIYQFLTLDVRAYLPPVHTLTVYFLKDLNSAAKKRMYPPTDDTFAYRCLDAVRRPYQLPRLREPQPGADLQLLLWLSTGHAVLAGAR